MSTPLAKSIGLVFQPGFLIDSQFYLALLAAPLTLLLMAFLLPGWSEGLGLATRSILLMVLWQPAIEELLFRGIIQGWLGRKHWARNQFAGIVTANLITSVLFVLAHLFHQPPLWAGAVLVPSLVFGYFRERHHHIYPALILHAVYNACFLLAVTNRNALPSA